MSTDERLRRAATDLADDVRGAIDSPAALDKVLAQQGTGRASRILVAALVLVLVGLVATVVVSSDERGEDVATETTIGPVATTAPTTPDPETDPRGGPTDGRASRQLPVTVTPSTGLAPGDTVQVTGEEFTPGEQVGIVMCTADALSSGAGSNECDLGGVTYATPGADGRVEASYIVRRSIITTRSGTVDCAAGGARCGITVGQVTDYDVSGLAEIAFPPLPPLPPASISVTPSEGLHHGQVVALSGEGFGAPVIAVELCAAGAEPDPPTDTGGGRCTYTDLGDAATGQGVPVGGTGAFSIDIPVWRAFAAYDQVGPATVDCAVEGCTLAVHSAEQAPPVALSFDPDSRLPAPPELSVTPSTGVRPGDPLTVGVTGLAPGSEATISGCATGPGQLTDGCSGALTLGSVVGDADGRASVVVTAPDPSDYGVDCSVPLTCGLTLAASAVPSSDPMVSAAAPAPLTFAP